MSRTMRLALTTALFALVGFAGACVSSPAASDKVEGDATADLFDGAADSAVRPTLLGWLGDGATEEGTFARDARYLAWAFEATAGDTVFIDAEGVSPYWLDTVVSIYRATSGLRPTGRALASNDDCDPTTLASCVELTAPATSTYVLVVRRYDRGTWGTFRVSLALERAVQACGSRGLGPCPEGTFCSWSPEAICGATDRPGVCARRPDACIELYQPVCGCDGATYGNACQAASAGVSVASEGECPASCEAMDAVGEGMCRRLPFGWRWDGGRCSVVQGCTCTGADCGSLYATDTDCYADRAGCDVVCGGLLGLECQPGEYCHFAIEATCGASDMTGTCAPRPERCTADYRPVCGCDGVTYSNACAAASAGVSVVSAGGGC